ncbi:hypothetical protein BON30_35470 [Cystobacter ferrugineus]|uniref:Uncharacterized protein n=1 Tax=Cystobacter ferrugineus TaxID=83449 RepID=A0A1L9B0Y1_9BACT|nr:hypothetical protein BON30_35470 [Cystobacter ferrugineus]
MLFWTLGLLPLSAGAGWSAFEWFDERKKARDSAARLTQDAAWHAFDGTLGESPLLGGVLKAARIHAPAQLLAACWFMQVGKWDLALEYLEGAAIRQSPEALLLRNLVERQPRVSQWRHAFFDAWQSLGRPDFRQSTLLPSPLQWSHLMADTWSPWDATHESRRLPLVVLNPELARARQDEVGGLVHASDSLPILMALREHLFAYEEQDPLRPGLLPAVDERIGQLAGSSPRTLQLALIPFLTGSLLSQPFSHGELETLENLVTLSEWKQPSSEQFFMEMLGHFEALPAPGHHAWSAATLAQGVSLGVWLYHRARASKAHLNDEDRRWLGRLLWVAGARLREQHSCQEVEQGLRLQMLGSEWMEHSPSRDDCITVWVDVGRWQKSLLQAAYYRWPLASLQEESCEPRARDELTWMRTFAEKIPLP